MRDNNEYHWRPDGSSRLRARATKARLSWSGAEKGCPRQVRLIEEEEEADEGEVSGSSLGGILERVGEAQVWV